MSETEEERVEQRRQRMSEILADIAGHAQSTSKQRCPYKSKPGLCTAKFSCRNQQASEAGLLCSHTGVFDYRLAWESRPDSYDKIRDKLRKIREEAALRRLSSGAPE